MKRASLSTTLMTLIALAGLLPARPTNAAIQIGAPMGWQFDGAQAVSMETLKRMYAHPSVAQFIDANRGPQINVQDFFAGHGISPFTQNSNSNNSRNAHAANPAVNNYLTNYAARLPHKTRSPMPIAEQRLLMAYLDHPHERNLNAFLALLNLNRSLLSMARYTEPGRALKHSIMALYFLNRSRDAGNDERWVAIAITKIERELANTIARQAYITAEEDHPAQMFFNDTFNYHEENRYTALDRLLLDFYQNPKNVYTAFTLSAGNLWVGGEADYTDPTVLENFVVGSYFALHTMQLAEQLETAWLANHNSTPRFRMAGILGGFFALHRRWLAQLVDDQAAIKLIDNEHRQWRLIHRAFHAFTVGVAFFDDPQLFAEGKAAWEDGFTRCLAEPSPPRTCIDAPRFSHNFSGFILGYVDYLLKAGDVPQAQFFLSLRNNTAQFPYMSNYATWDLGRDSWTHREQYATQIAALYGNADPSDDPTHFFLQKRKWGGSTANCQTCHQAQSTLWTEEQQRLLGTTLPPEPEATVGHWPVVTTTWYGARLNN